MKLIALDVDGVLTDGGLYYGHEGEVLKRFDVKDGHGLVLCRKLGIPVAILTARSSSIVAVRARELGIEHVVQGAKDKLAGFLKLLAMATVDASGVCYMGDDINDLPVIEHAGFSACPADAANDVKKKVDYVCKAQSGRGAVRELCELILRAQGLWDRALSLRHDEEQVL